MPPKGTRRGFGKQPVQPGALDTGLLTAEGPADVLAGGVAVARAGADIGFAGTTGMFTPEEREDLLVYTATLGAYDPNTYNLYDPASKKRARRAAAAVVQMQRQHPELRELFQAAPTAAAAATTLEWVMPTLSRYYGEDLPREMMMAAADVADDLDPTRSPETLLEEAKVEASWWKEWSLGEAARVLTAEGVEMEGGRLFDLRKLTDQPVQGRLFEDGRRLVITTETDDGVRLNTIDLLLDEGTRVGSASDMLVALVEAWSGKKHKLLSGDGGIMGDQTPTGAMAETLGSIVDAVGRKVDQWNAPWNWLVANAQQVASAALGPAGEPFELQGAESSWEMKRQAQEEQFRQTVADLRRAQASDEALLMAAAQQIRYANPEMSLVDATRNGMGVLASPESRAEWEQVVQISDEKADEIVAEMMELNDPESGLKGLVDAGLGAFTNLAGAYGWMLDQLAVHAVDFVGDAGQGLMSLVGLGGLAGEDGPGGWSGFKNSFEWTEANRLSEYWNIDGPAGLWLDIGANFLIDPFLWLFPGPAAMTRRWHRTISDAAKTHKFLKNPTIRRMADLILDAKRADDPMMLEALLAGMPSRSRRAIVESSFGSADEVLGVLERQLPAHGGLWLPDPFGRSHLRNSVEVLERLGRAARNSDDARGVLFEALGSFERGTAIPLSELAAADSIVKTLMQWYGTDKAGFAQALGKLRAAERAAWSLDDAGRVAGVVADDAARQAVRAARRGLWAEARRRLPKVNLSGMKGTAEQKVARLLDDASAWADEIKALDAEASYLDNLIGTGLADEADETRRAFVQSRLDQLKSGNAQRLEQLMREQRSLRRKHPSQPGVPGGGRPPEVAKRLRDLKAEIDDLAKQPGGRGLTANADTYEWLLAQHDEFLRANREFLDRLETAKVARAVGKKPTTMRDIFERLVAELEDEFGESVLGLTRKTTGPKDPRLGRRPLDWAEAFGTAEQYGEDVSRAMPLAETSAGQADVVASGMLAQPFSYYLKVSPQAALAYKMMKGTKGWEHFLAKANRATADAARVARTGKELHPTVRGLRAGKEWFQRAYFLGVLTRPSTALKSYLDEAYRFTQQGGLRRLVTPVRASFADDTKSLPFRLENMPERSRLAANQLDQGAGFSRRAVSWKPVARKKHKAGAEILKDDKVHAESAFEWLGGQLLPDPALTALSQAVQEVASTRNFSILEVLDNVPVSEWPLNTYAEWWLRRGRYQAKGVYSPAKKAPRLAKMHDAVETQRNALRYLAHSSDAPAEVAEQLVGMSATGTKLQRGVAAHERLVRKLGPVPTRHFRKIDQGAGDMVMDFLYGKPGRQRYGMFHSRFQEMGFEVFDTAAAGRMLTEEKLVELGMAANVDDAARLLVRNQELASRVAHEHGLYTSRMIDQVADSFARSQADHLIYAPGARSALGTRIARHVPFGPAQYDWLSFYGREATKAATVGLFGKGIRELSLGGRPLPLNLHLMARAGEYSAMFDKIRDANGDESWFLPTDVWDELTFFPRLDDAQHFLIDMGPGFGPVDSWLLALASEAIDSIPEGDTGFWERLLRGANDFVTTISPAISFQDDPSRWTGLLENYVIDNPGSALNLLGSVAGWVRSQGGDPGALESSPLFRDAVDSILMETVAGWDAGTIGDLDPESVLVSAGEMIRSQTMMEAAVRMLPFGGMFGREDLTTDDWEGFYSELGGLVEAGLLGEVPKGELDALWEKHQSGQMTPPERDEFHSQVRTILFGLRDFPNGDLIQADIVSRHPELAVAMTSRWRCKVDGRTGKPLDPAGCDGRLRPVIGETRAEFERFVDGIGTLYEERPAPERIQEIKWRVAKANRTVIRSMYMALSGETTFNPGSDATEKKWEGEMLPRLPDEMADMWRTYGVPIPTSGTMPFQEFAEHVQRINSSLSEFSFPEVDNPAAEAIRYRVERDELGAAIVDTLSQVEKIMNGEGYDDPADYPAEVRQMIQESWGQLVQGGTISVEDYNLVYASKWGPYEWEPLIPGRFDTLSPDDVEKVYEVDPSDIFVHDGDTLDVMTETGPVRFRLIGVNAPDSPMPGFEESFKDLFDLLKGSGYDDVKLVVWRPDFFGVTAGRNFETGEPRLKAWLFVNGVPIFHEESFTFRNPTGRSSGTVYRPLPRPEDAPVGVGVS